MKIENSFTIDIPIVEAWALLTDLAQITPCLPGAKLTGEEAGVHRGAVKINVGSVTAEYRGTAEFLERDMSNHRVVIDGRGSDSRGAGNGQALISAQMTELGDQTLVVVSSDLRLTGKFAQFGRGMIQDISDKLVAQFADCLAAALDETPTLEATLSASADSAPAAAAVEHQDDDHGEVLDLIKVAGGAALKRLGPVAILAVVIVIVLLISI